MSSAAIPVSQDLSAITVEGDQIPNLKFPAPWAIEKTTVKVLKEGTSDQVVGEGLVEVNYLGVNGRTGETFDTSFGKSPAVFSADGVIPGFSKALIGQKVGSRVLVGITAEDGYPEGRGDQIGAGDNLLFVIDILSAPANEAQGEAVALPADAPQIEVDASGPKVKSPNDLPQPTGIKLYPMVKGGGKPVATGQNATLKLRIFDWTGKVIEDAWTQPQPLTIPSGDVGPFQSLVGQPVGSRVVVVTPPADPTGTAAPQNQPLIFVIDILSAS